MTATNQEPARCTIEADLALLIRYQNGDEEALANLVKCHLGLITFWARKIRANARWADLDDIKQEGSIGFVQAAKKFDTAGNGDFHGVARNFVRAAIYRSPEISRVKRSQYRRYLRVRTTTEKLMVELDRMPTLAEISKATGLTVKQVDSALNVVAAFPLSLEEAHDGSALEESVQSQALRDAIRQLDSYGAQIIIRCYFYGQTDGEIAMDLGRSEDAIRMARNRAEKKLKNLIFGNGVEKDGVSRH